jgi:hypothetical protein
MRLGLMRGKAIPLVRGHLNTTAVQSATLAAIGYESNGGILQLEFRSRAVYRYFGVPGPVYEALWSAPSKGSYFNLAIRGRFPFSVVPARVAVSRGEC